jgi:ABC-type glycerol-3-phosphate transport system substrate-binding protein
MAADRAVVNSVKGTGQNSITSYYNYYQKYRDEIRPEKTIELSPEQIKTAEYIKISKVKQDGKDANLLGDANQWCEWDLNIPESGLYSLYVNYYPYKDQLSNPQIAVSIDSKRPFNEAGGFELPLIWADEKIVTSASLQKDNTGNELRPNQIESPHWNEIALYDILGQYSEPYLFYFEKGAHTLRISNAIGEIALGTIALENRKPAQTYNQYILKYNQMSNNAELFKKEAEDTIEKTSPRLYPMSDRSSPATTPNDTSKILFNTIGQTNWEKPGEKISWQISVTNEGWYNIVFRARQNFSQGMNSYRTFKIDGETPFTQAQEIKFQYDLNWYMKVLGNGETPIYLTKGNHILSMETTPGEIASVLREINQIIMNLNTLYRKIIVITGTSPDIYRDYQLEKQIPGLFDEIKNNLKLLKSVSTYIVKTTGTTGSASSVIEEDVYELNRIVNEQYTFVERIPSLSGIIEGLGSLYLTLCSQPLELDSILFVPTDKAIPRASAAFFESLVFSIKKFFASFYNNYTMIGESNSDKKTANVWVSTGRDQAQVILGLISNIYSPKSDIKINLSLVDTSSTLIQATLAGKGPDIALMLTKEAPVNLAMRGGLVNLNQFNIGDMYPEYYDSAWIPYRYQGGIYALPESQSFDMLFYRTDIFAELDIKVPTTWDDFYKVIEKLQSNNLHVGIQEMDRSNLSVSIGINTFDKFLFQNGGTYYNDKLNKTTFDSDIANESFEKLVRLYTDYGVDREFDFYNRFRSGEMPMAIQPYSMYNLIFQAAPEITGLWSFAPIPGTVKKNGEIDHSESSAGTGCVMLKSSEKKGISKEAFDFMSWWVSSDTQARYGNELESIMGPAARYNPANIKAFDKIPWKSEERLQIKEQWKWVTDVPQIPGNYYVSRNLTAAIRLSIEENKNPRRILSVYNREINNEILRKRKEFHLN